MSAANDKGAHWAAWGVCKSLSLRAGSVGRYSLYRSFVGDKYHDGEFFKTPRGRVKQWSSRKEAQAFADKLNAESQA